MHEKLEKHHSFTNNRINEQGVTHAVCSLWCVEAEMMESKLVVQIECRRQWRRAASFISTADQPHQMLQCWRVSVDLLLLSSYPHSNVQTLGCLATQVPAMDKQSNTHSHADTLGKPRNSGGKRQCPPTLFSSIKNKDEESVVSRFNPVTLAHGLTPEHTCETPVQTLI